MKTFRLKSDKKLRFLFILPLIITIAFFSVLYSCSSDDDAGGPFMNNAWIDPAFGDNFIDEDVVVWFDHQFLDQPESYLQRQSEFNDRQEMRNQVVAQLKSLSDQSYANVQTKIDSLIDNGHITEFKRHWIINGFSCKLKDGGIEGLKTIEGIARIFKKLYIDTGDQSDNGPEFVLSAASPFVPSALDEYTWNIEQLNVPEVWINEGYNGEGVLNVVHDFGFRLDTPAISASLYRNPDEIPDNGVDDDQNGYVDDYHGFNFDANSSHINNPAPLSGFPGLVHGSMVAALISGRIATDSIMGVAPNSQWAAVRGIKNFEEMVEWSVDQGADTYTMSFSIANMMEFRTHWRKVIEHGTYAGIFFVSGAGNFADPNNANYVPVPNQMRNPEDIPAVFSVAGLDSLYVRPAFSSQGPVVWNTEYYNEGQIDKPDFVTFNIGISYLNVDSGELVESAAGNSFAGPQLTGIIALMLSKDPSLTPWAVRAIFENTAIDVLGPGYENQSGHGLIDALAAVNSVN